MTDHKALPVKGYTEQSDANIKTVNDNKKIEERVLRQLDRMTEDKNLDQRMIALARTNVQEAFMWANRAVFQPERIDLDEGD